MWTSGVDSQMSAKTLNGQVPGSGDYSRFGVSRCHGMSIA